MHFRCIDYLPLKQRGFKLICSKHQKKKKKKHKFSLAIPCLPRGGRQQFVGFQLLFLRHLSGMPSPGSFCLEHLPAYLKTQKPSHCCSQSLPDLLHWREDRKDPVPFAKCLVCSVGDGFILPGTRSCSGRALLVTQSLPSIPCNSGKLHFSISFSSLSSDKISADLTALTCETSAGQGSFRGGEVGFQLWRVKLGACGNIFQ